VIELADIFRQYGPAYRAKFGEQLLPSHRQVMWAIEHCRTEALGGHVYHCPECDQDVYQYHSCRNRHCPKCQNENAQHWLEQQQALRLPVSDFMLTFTLPAPLRPIARSHQALLYDLLFRTSASATQHLAADPRLIGGQLGLVGVLHTWGRTLTYHPHVHYLLPAGGLTDDGQTWRPARDDFLVPVKALSGIFRARFRDALRSTELFDQVPAAVWEHDWGVHCKAVGSGETAFKYLAPYIFRVAISNSRLLKVEHDQVTFRYRASDTGQSRTCTLAAEEFIHRFLQHVLPKGFVKGRYYGFLSVAQRAPLTRLRQQLAPVMTGAVSTSAPCVTDESPPKAEAFVTPFVTDVPNLTSRTLPSPADPSASSTVSSSSETSDQQTVTISPPSRSSTHPRDVRCPACGRRLLRGSVLFPSQGHPP
jgi:hypothetical protein